MGMCYHQDSTAILRTERWFLGTAPHPRRCTWEPESAVAPEMAWEQEWALVALESEPEKVWETAMELAQGWGSEQNHQDTK